MLRGNCALLAPHRISRQPPSSGLQENAARQPQPAALACRQNKGAQSCEQTLSTCIQLNSDMSKNGHPQVLHPTKERCKRTLQHILSEIEALSNVCFLQRYILHISKLNKVETRGKGQDGVGLQQGNLRQKTSDCPV